MPIPLLLFTSLPPSAYAGLRLHDHPLSCFIGTMTPNDVCLYHPLLDIFTAFLQWSFGFDSSRPPESFPKREGGFRDGQAKAISFYIKNKEDAKQGTMEITGVVGKNKNEPADSSRKRVLNAANETHLILFFRVLQNDHIPVHRKNGH